MRQVREAALATTAVATLLTAAATPALAADTERVSVNSAEEQANGTGVGSIDPSMSADGRRVTFTSSATNLATIDPASGFNVFLRDRGRGTTALVSVSSDDVPGNGLSSQARISDSGRHVAFVSRATNLVAGDTNGVQDTFVRDLRRGATERVSVSSAGDQANASSRTSAVSRDGRFVVFQSPASNLVASTGAGFLNLFVRDRQRGVTTVETVGPGGEPGDQPFGGGTSADFIKAHISPDGRFVGFDSTATNLVAGDTNGRRDVFLRDRRTGRTRLVSVAPGGGAADGDSREGIVSDDGRYVAFESEATNLVAGDTNGFCDIFVRDMRRGTTTRVNLGPGGAQADGCSDALDMTPDGRRVLFLSFATNLIPGVTLPPQHVYVADRNTGRMALVDVNDGYEVGDGPAFSNNGEISDNGRIVTFFSAATNLVPGDTNALNDVFVRILGGGRERVVVPPALARKGTGAGGGADASGSVGDGVGRW